MDVVGFSGLNNSRPFKRSRFADLDNRYSRICQGFDSAAVLVNDTGVVAAAAEERFVRTKATGEFPLNAINYCLDSGKKSINDLDCIAHAFDYRPYKALYDRDDLAASQYQQVYDPSNQLELLGQHFPLVEDWRQRFVSVPHHLAHAASAYYPSGFTEALIVVADGMGEMEGVTVAVGSGDNIEILQTIPSINSLGILYSVFTLYLGFEFNMDEYKVMGLAPYGNPRTYFAKVMNLIDLRDDGTHTVPLLHRNATPLDRETYAGSIATLIELFGPAREPKSEITRHHQDIAAALQTVLQSTMLHLMKQFQRNTGMDNLATAGGVALNCSANGVLKRSGIFKQSFIQPAAGDDGSALGAALVARKQRGGSVQIGKKMRMPYWGPDITVDGIKQALAEHTGLDIQHYPKEAGLLQDIAQRLVKGEIIGWCQGRMEFGPRALGARSIIADPTNGHIRDKINALVKKREDFRPFAPAVTAEDAAKYFEIAEGDTSLYEYMLCVAQVRKFYRQKLPAITHVDGSARVQTVSEDSNSRFWRLLRALETENGLPMVLNTSFNVMGQPVICNEKEAVDTFVNAGLDTLAIGNFVICRKC